MVPDFNFHCWPQVRIVDYEKQIEEIDFVSRDTFLINKVGWIGNSDTHRNRKNKCKYF